MVITINIGSLDKRITFIGYNEEENEIGQTVLVKKEIKTVWARVETARGREYYEAQKIRNENSYKFITRFYADVTEDMLIKFKERIFEIKNIINPYMKNEMLEIMCIEKVKCNE